jgi:hypothetical protein
MFYTALNSVAIEDWEPTGTCEYVAVPKLAQGVRPGDGILLFDWNSDDRTAVIKALGHVQLADQTEATVSISWKDVDFKIAPGSQGMRHWRDKWIMNLVSSRVSAYKLKEKFAESFEDDSFLRTRVDDPFILRRNVDPDIASLIPQQGFVYVLFDGELWKIGKALDISRRKMEIERQIGKKLELLHSIESSDYSRSEAELHRRYQHHRIRGEWFSLLPEELRELMLISQM